ncbi:bifunctional metallophosphatase/5'-nucleotidase [Paracoccus jeotgali]|uniref:Multifunctional 2',3'-cyclic-nucleotide 2'-phosphodiesterase/5'-nucleotidase/3'-nucleotidase n=1 Tax=Paracoccus jeotgali TaxID=2065379 RepID=A0A2K9MLQ9_9RHOB|nr:bifunctional metallophosphatase/5'-nucleotidase [Paracoccus jeotgali]AUM75545.1 multifunctional 2',3'-cyclic-nucleotide 2'-phosphodiesterase/5'-nucleotidase/3'-nucleotidase [Paracoccus jeotgali]
MRTRLLASVAVLALGPAMAQAESVLHILHTNDFHSRVESINKFDSSCDHEAEEAGECAGGTARLATKLAELRQQFEAAGEPYLLLDAGDQFQGSLFYTTYKGEDTAEFMNQLGYDAMVVGNHEFDDGPMVLSKLIDNLNFPVVSANLDVSQDNELNGKLEKSVVLERGGEKVGIIGLTATDTDETSSPGKSVIFQDDAEALAAEVERLTDEGVNRIIALTHIGLPRDLELAESVPGVDLFVGGHTHTPLGEGVEGSQGDYPTMSGEVPVVQAGSYGRYLGHVTLTFDDDGNVTSVEGAPILLDASVTPDPDILARVKELAGPINELKTKIVAETAAPIGAERTDCRARECAMGTLVADAMLDRVKDQGIDIAIQNGGGLRAGIDAGPISMGEIIAVLPFQNTLATFRLKGADVVAALENGASEIEDGAGRFAQVAGLKYTVDPSAEPGQRISEVLVMKDGDWKPIEPGTEYGVVTNNYMRNGGDGYAVFAEKGSQAYDFGPDLADVLAEYIVAQGAEFVAETDGRITVKGEAGDAEAGDAAAGEAEAGAVDAAGETDSKAADAPTEADAAPAADAEPATDAAEPAPAAQ